MLREYAVHILVVDDHLPTIELMRLTLTSFGHSVRSATTVVEALSLVASKRPDVVLSDLTFSAGADTGEDGYALARALRANPGHADLAILAITGVNSPSERQAALDSGFNDVVVKPFNVESLLEQIDALDPRTANLGGRRRE